MADNELHNGDYVRIYTTNLIGRIVEERDQSLYAIIVMPEDNYGHEDYISPNGEFAAYLKTKLERIKSPSYEIGQHLLYSHDGKCAVTVVQRNYETKFNCWMYQFAEGGPWFSEDEHFHSFPMQFKKDEHVLLKDNTSPHIAEAIIIKPSVFRGHPSYHVEVVETHGIFNWLASDILPFNDYNNTPMQEEKFNIAKYLTGHEGEEFFSPNLGPLKYKGVNTYNSNQLLFFDKKSELVKVRKNSVINSLTGLASLYPSKESFASDCFHPREVWEKWADEQLVYGVVINIATYKNQDEIEDGYQSFSRRFHTEEEMNDFIDKLANTINTKTE